MAYQENNEMFDIFFLSSIIIHDIGPQKESFDGK